MAWRFDKGLSDENYLEITASHFCGAFLCWQGKRYLWSKVFYKS